MNNTTIDSNREYLVGIVIVAMAVGVLFGYDIAVVVIAGKALKAFFTCANDFVYTDQEHIVTMVTALIGCVVGYYLSPLAMMRFGYRSNLLLSALLFLASALGCMCPEMLLFEQGQPIYLLFVVFNVHRFIGGLGIGLALAICIKDQAAFSRKLMPWALSSIVVGLLAAFAVCALIQGHHSDPVIVSIGQGFNSVLPESDPWTIGTGWWYMFGSEAVLAVLFILLIAKK